MKKINPILFLFVILIVLSGSCEKPVINNCTLTKVENGTSILEFFFQNDQLVAIEQYDEVSLLLQYSYLITRDPLGRVDYLDAFYADGTLFYRRKFTYNADGNIGRVYFLSDTNGDLFPETYNGYREFAYNSDKQIFAASNYNASFTYIDTDYYEWVNGNVTRMDNGFGTAYELYTYDDKKNMYGNISEIFCFTLSLVHMSANNVVLISYFDAANNPTGTYENTYSYTSDGYPEAESVHGSSFEYNCVPE